MSDNKLTVRAVERALDILLCFTSRQDLTLTEISRETGLNKSTVHRLLTSLERKGFLIRDPETEKFRLGFRLWELSANLARTDDPAVVLLPEMQRLRDAVGETMSLYIRDGKDRVRVQAVESTQTIRRVAPVGARLPLAVGASSKVLVAYAPQEARDMILEDPSWPDYVDKHHYVQQLDGIRKQGYATSIEEREIGTSAIAVPIFGRSGQLSAALAISGPASRLTLERMKEHAPLIMEAARRMGKMVK